MDVKICLTWLDWFFIVVFLIGMLGVGFYFARRTKNFEDYYLASKGITMPLLVGTLVSTYYGLDALFGGSEVGFMEGMAGFFAITLPGLSMYVIMAFLAPKFREFERNTFSDILGDHYGNFPRVISACCSFFYSTNTMEIMGMGFIFSLIFDIPFAWAALISTVIVVVYTYSGGLWAVATTDMIKFVIMAVTLGIALILVWGDVGGYEGVYTGLSIQLGKNPWHMFHPLGGYLSLGIIGAYFLTNFAILCEPAFLQRIFASKTPNEARNALLIGTPLWAAYSAAATLLGVVALAAVGLGIIGEPHPNEALITIVCKYIPAGFTGLFLAGVLAAAMSTADSYFLVGSGNLVYDIYRPIFKPDISDKKLTQYTKYGILICAALSLGLAFYFQRIMGVWVFQASIIINTVLIPLYACVFLKKMKKTKLAGALSTAVGFFGTIAYYVLVTTLGYFSEDWGTYMLDINILGRTYVVWQEYGIFLIPPFVIVAFIIGQLLGKEETDKSAEEAV